LLKVSLFIEVRIKVEPKFIKRLERYVFAKRYLFKVNEYKNRVPTVSLLGLRAVFLYPTEKQECAWSLREMGSTRVGGMGEGPTPQAGSKISS
jgi:hypothetical protein